MKRGVRILEWNVIWEPICLIPNRQLQVLFFSNSTRCDTSDIREYQYMQFTLTAHIFHVAVISHLYSVTWNLLYHYSIQLLPLTSPRGVCFSNTFPSWKTSVSQCYYTLEHGLRKQIFSIARHPTTYMLWASRQICQGSSTTSFSGAYLSYSHNTHQPTFVTKPWARREHSHFSTVSLALEFEGMLKYSHSSHPST